MLSTADCQEVIIGFATSSGATHLPGVLVRSMQDGKVHKKGLTGFQQRESACARRTDVALVHYEHSSGIGDYDTTKDQEP